MATVSEAEPAQPGVMQRGWRIQTRVIGALMMRELHTRYGRQNIGYLWLILEPMMLATAIGLLHARSATHYSGDIKPVPMALIGYCNFMTFRALVSRAEGSLEGSASLFYHRTVAPLDIMIARALLESAGTTMSFVILMGLAVATGITNPPERPLILLAGILLMIWLSFNLSLIVCGVTHERKAIGRLVHPLTYVMMPISGAFFMMQFIPGPIRDILLTIPLAHIFELLRYGWFKAASPNYFDLWYLGAWIIGTMILGLLLMAVARQRIQLT